MEDEITLLTKEQLENLEMFKKYGIEASATDFCIFQKEKCIFFEYVDYWIKTPQYDYMSYVLNLGENNSFIGISYSNHTYGVRPVMSLSKVYQSKKDLKINKVNEIKEIEYGEYPQSKVDDELDKKLEILYQQNELLKTNKKYTVINKSKTDKLQEFFYNDNKYVRDEKEKETHWFKVEPIKWLVNESRFEQDNIAISKNILTSMPFSYNNDNDYDKSDIKVFLEKYFVKEINKNINEEKINDLIDLVSILYPKENQKEKVLRINRS